MAYGSVYFVVGGLFATVAFLLLRAAGAERRLKATRRAAARQRADLTAERDRLQADVAALEAALAAEQAAAEERAAALVAARDRMEEDFKGLAARILNDAQGAFLDRADAAFRRHQETQNAEADAKKAALDAVIAPMREALQKYESGLAEWRTEETKGRGELIGRLGELAKSAADVRLETQKLAAALRSGPKTRGRWGEEQLRNVVEAAGLVAHVDFVEQPPLDDAEGLKRPDMVVNLPGGRTIAVDAKVSLSAYFDALEAEEAGDEGRRRAALKRHADDLWAHVRALAGKDYAASLRASLDVVVMFVPGENYFAAAAEARPSLVQDAFDRRVLVATPMTLLAILKAASFNWRREKAVENASRVAALAKDLYESLAVMGGHMGELGRALDRAVGKYNAAAGGLERRVWPRARKFAEYELPGVEAPLPAVGELEAAPARLSPPEGEGILTAAQDGP